MARSTGWQAGGVGHEEPWGLRQAGCGEKKLSSSDVFQDRGGQALITSCEIRRRKFAFEIRHYGEAPVDLGRCLSQMQNLTKHIPTRSPVKNPLAGKLGKLLRKRNQRRQNRPGQIERSRLSGAHLKTCAKNTGWVERKEGRKEVEILHTHNKK